MKKQQHTDSVRGTRKDGWGTRDSTLVGAEKIAGPVCSNCGKPQPRPGWCGDCLDARKKAKREMCDDGRLNEGYQQAEVVRALDKIAAENDPLMTGESYEQAAPVPNLPAPGWKHRGTCGCSDCAARRGEHTCYVCGKSEGLGECTHCGSTICKNSRYDGGLCPLCAAMRSNMAKDAQRQLGSQHNRIAEVERASELAARASALAGYDAGVTAAIMQIEDRAKSAPGVAGDVLNAMARELAASIKPGVRHV